MNDEFTGNAIEVFPIKGYCELMVFQNKNDLEMAASAHPKIVVPIIGAGRSNADNDFPGVFIALRKDETAYHCNGGDNSEGDSCRMTNNSTFITLGNEVDDFLKQVEIYDSPENLCSVAFDLGILHHRVHESYFTNQLTKEEHDNLYHRITATLQHIQKLALIKQESEKNPDTTKRYEVI